MNKWNIKEWGYYYYWSKQGNCANLINCHTDWHLITGRNKTWFTGHWQFNTMRCNIIVLPLDNRQYFTLTFFLQSIIPWFKTQVYFLKKLFMICFICIQMSNNFLVHFEILSRGSILCLALGLDFLLSWCVYLFNLQFRNLPVAVSRLFPSSTISARSVFTRS